MSSNDPISAHDKAAQTSFARLKFPGRQHTLSGRGRHHVHEYWRSPGGAPEKGGRGLYTVSIRATFHDRFRQYPDLYPNTMNKLRALYENQTTDQLVHPTAGSFPAFITDWHQVKDAKVRSGEEVDITFLEDNDQFKLATGFSQQAANAAELEPSARALAFLAAYYKTQLLFKPNELGLLDQLQGAVNSVLAIKDTVDLYGNLVSAKVAQLMNIAKLLDATPTLQNPTSWPLVDKLHEVWAAADRLQRDLQSKQAPLQFFIVPFTQSVGAIAQAIYGDAAKQRDLLALNSDVINDAMRVPANTKIRYYPAAP